MSTRRNKYMKNKKSSKKRTVIIASIILLIFLVVGFIFRLQIGNIIFYIQMIGIDKDIIIEKKDEPSFGGYAQISYDYYVDLNKRKIYEVIDYDVYGITHEYGESGDHYAITKKKKLTDKEINDILELTEAIPSSNYNRNSLYYFFEEYYKITYNGKTTTVKSADASVLVNIINTMK